MPRASNGNRWAAAPRRLVERIALALYTEGDWQRIGGGRLVPDGAALAAAGAELKQLRAILDLTGALVTLRTEMVRAIAGTEPEWTAFVDGCFADMVDATTANLEVLCDAQLQAMVELRATPVSSALLAVEAGHGRGIVPTARGELCYELDLGCRRRADMPRERPDRPRVRRRRPRGDPAAAPAASGTLLAVRWIVAAYDPCIEVKIEQAPD